MKKCLYLISLLTLTACAISEPQESMNEENYLRVFIHEFGIIDPTHTWGFGQSRAKSRDANVNYNEWVNPPHVTAAEANAVMTYVKNNTIGSYTGHGTIEDIDNYFITHVGHNEEKSTAYNGQELDYNYKSLNHLMVGANGEASMDEIENHIANGSSSDDKTENVGNWIHCNNFNASQNIDNDGDVLIEAEGAYNFAYHNSVDSKYHDRYVIVPGSDIFAASEAEATESGKPYLPTEHYDLVDYYYVCFDFIADGSCTWVQMTYTVTDGDDVTTYTDKTYSLPGYYESIDDVDDIVLEALIRKEHAKESSSDPEIPEAATISITSKILPPGAQQQLNMKVDPNNVYNDWVIRIVANAKTYADIEAEEYSIRIMVEDLAVMAAHELTNNSSDWDFNDLVFDTHFHTDGTAYINIQALGGTLPIYIATPDYDPENPDPDKITAELHSYYGKSSTVMINTAVTQLGPKNITDQIKGLKFFAESEYETYKNAFDRIKILVEYPDGSGTKVMEMTAEIGKAPSKIAVPHTVAWMPERKNIKEDYPGFTDWVQDEGMKFWEGTKNEQNNSTNGD